MLQTFVRFEHKWGDRSSVEIAKIETKGTHRKHCLCFAGCQKFKPGQPDHCEIAGSLYALDVRYNLVTPVFECPEFVAPEGCFVVDEKGTVLDVT